MDKYTLRSYRYLIKEIEQLKAEQRQLYDGKLGAIVISDMPHGNDVGNPTLSCAEKLDKLQHIINNKLDKAITLRLEIECAIESLADPLERNLMRVRYIEGLAWEKVAVTINYEWAQMHRIHSKILTKLENDIS